MLDFTIIKQELEAQMQQLNMQQLELDNQASRLNEMISQNYIMRECCNAKIELIDQMIAENNVEAEI